MARKESLVAVLFESLGHESFEAHLHVYPCDVKLINLECVLSNISVSNDVNVSSKLELFILFSDKLRRIIFSAFPST